MIRAVGFLRDRQSAIGQLSCLAVLADGSVVLSTLSEAVRVWRSDDGQSYQRLPDVPGKGWDRPFLIEAPRGDAGARLYATLRKSSPIRRANELTWLSL